MILVFAGVQSDLPDAAQQRLPQRAEDPLRRRIEGLLHDLGPRLAVGAAATGSDIIIAEAALAVGVPVRIVLPFAREAFEQTSLHARDRRWRERFTALLDAAGPAVTCGLDPADPRVFEQHNQVLLERAAAWAGPREPVHALAIRPGAGTARSTTDDFAERCHRMAIPLLDVDPLAPVTPAPLPTAPGGRETGPAPSG